MKHKVSYNDLQVGDILILLDNQHAEKVVGDVVAKEENNAGKIVRVRVGQNLPTTIYVEDFLASEGHEVYNVYTIERVVGNMRVIEKGGKSVSVPKTMFAISWLSETSGNEACAGVCSSVFGTREEAENQLRKSLNCEKADMLDRFDEGDIVVDYAKGVVHDSGYNSFIKYEIHEVDVKL